jgi:hypothetical protein
MEKADWYLNTAIAKAFPPKTERAKRVFEAGAPASNTRFALYLEQSSLA